MNTSRPQTQAWTHRAAIGRVLLGVVVLTAALFLAPVANAFASGQVTVVLTGAGTGNVAGGNEEEPGGIECGDEGGAPGPSCEHEFQLFSTGGFTATGGPGSVFTGWTTGPEACLGSTEPCSVRFGLSSPPTTLTANFDEAKPSAIVSIDPVEPAAIAPCSTGITAAGACFSGTINPNGGAVTSCRFELVAQSDPEGFAGQGKESYPCRNPDGSDASSISEELNAEHPVIAIATELEPNTAYRVRLYAAKAGAVPAIAEAPPFTTAAPIPSVVTGKAWSISDTGATLTGTVNPRNSSLSACRFEFGAGEGYGQSVPCSSLPEGGNVPVMVIANLGGLSPETTYHFRLVVGNAAGPQASLDYRFETRTPIIFPERHYELVSPVDTNGIPPNPEFASADGEGLAYGTFLPAPPGARSGKPSLYVASRKANGSWVQRSLNPAPGEGEPDSGVGGELFTSDLGQAVFQTGIGVDPDDQNGSIDVYLEDLGSGAPTWLSRDPSLRGPQTERGEFVPRYISKGGGQVVFSTAGEPFRRLLPDAQPGAPALYEWNRGALGLLSRVPSSGASCDDFSGPACIQASEPVVLGSGFNLPGTTREAVSADGSRVAFETGGEGEGIHRLYIRLEDQRTLQASASAPGAPPLVGEEPKQVNFAGADSRMDDVFFTSSSPLTADSSAPDIDGGLVNPAPADLYDYDVGSESLRDLTPAAGGAGVLRVYDVSEDGRRIYFTSSRRLDPAGRLSEEGPGLQGAAGGPNLYLAELDGGAVHLTFIATIDQKETTNHEPEWYAGLGVSVTPPRQEIDAGPDGTLLAFRDRLPAVPGRATGGRPQVFVYDAGRHELNCASCPGDGIEPAAAANLAPGGKGLGDRQEIEGELEPIAEPAFATNELGAHVRDITSAGAVFFQTSTPLAPGDTNGKGDVYEWRGGKVSLISAGVGARPSIFGGASVDGSTVFFRSSNGLAPGASRASNISTPPESDPDRARSPRLRPAAGPTVGALPSVRSPCAAPGPPALSARATPSRGSNAGRAGSTVITAASPGSTTGGSITGEPTATGGTPDDRSWHRRPQGRPPVRKGGRAEGSSRPARRRPDDLARDRARRPSAVRGPPGKLLRQGARPGPPGRLGRKSSI